MIEQRTYGDSGCNATVTLACPCGRQFSNNSGRAFRDHLIHDHTPEDFGL